MAAPTIVQAKFDVSQAGSSQATISISPTSSLTSGNYLWVACWGDATMATATISDTVNTYTARGAYGYAGCWARHWTAPVSSSGTPTITVTPASNRRMTIMVVEVSGVDGSTPVDLAGQQWQNWADTNFPASPLNFGATAYAEELILAAVGTQPNLTNSRDFGANTGWTQYSEVTSGPSICLIYSQQTSIGTYDPDFTLTSGGAVELMFVGVSFHGAAGGGPVTVAVSGSAMTNGIGTQSPVFSLPL